MVKENSGIPYLYSLKDYSLTQTIFSEVSSTFKEETLEAKQASVHSSNPLISQTYTQLTQLAFDSGKMKADEYKAILGNGACQRADCLDKLCVQYKLLCCQKNPSSPNC